MQYIRTIAFRASAPLVALGLLCGAFGSTPGLAEDLAPPPPGPNSGSTAAPEVEPELKGKALKKHKKAVRKLVKTLDREKNRESVQLHIERIGAAGTRVGRDALMLFATGNKNHEFVSHAFMALGKIKDLKSIDFLCGKVGIRNKSFLIALSAAEALGKARDPRAAPHLLDVMLSKRSKIEVVSACALAVARSAPKDERVIETLLKQSRHRKDTIRSNTLEAVGYLETDPAVARLTEALTKDKLARARAAAATGLGWTYRTDVIPTLDKAIKADNSMHVKTAASDAIRVIRAGKKAD